MFEKEAEEYTDSVDGYEIKTYSTSDVERAFQKGAEFDYNKAKKEIEEELLKCYQGYPEEEGE